METNESPSTQTDVAHHDYAEPCRLCNEPIRYGQRILKTRDQVTHADCDPRDEFGEPVEPPVAYYVLANAGRDDEHVYPADDYLRDTSKTPGDDLVTDDDEARATAEAVATTCQWVSWILYRRTSDGMSQAIKSDGV